MIVRQFLQWLRHAPPGTRAEATSALARAYLYSDLGESDRAAAEGAMIMLLDDPSPLVRRALSEVFAGSDLAPPAIVHSLAMDQADVAGPVLERSPLLLDADLVDAVGTGDAARQTAIATRTNMPGAVSAALAEVGCAAACLSLLENPDAVVAGFSIDRIVERHGHLAPIRDALLLRGDLSPVARQALVAKLSRTLADFVASRRWLPADRAERVAKEACEKATVTLASEAGERHLGTLIGHLRESGQLTAGLVLRALLSGNVALFEESLVELTGIPVARVAGIVHDGRSGSFRALYDKAGLPAAAYPAFREAVEAMREGGFVAEIGGASRLQRRMVERVLTRCGNGEIGEVEPLLTLLRRFAAEAAREEARLFCNELVAEDRIAFDDDDRYAA
jgi:uncharacterized protein (DUF2336 family)